MVSFIGIVIAPVILIPILITEKDQGNYLTYNLLCFLLGGIIIVTLVFNFFFSIKKNFEEYSKTLAPGLSVFCWFFIIIPFVGIIPITIVNIDQEEDIAELYQITVGITALIVFLGVGTLAIIGNLFFNRIEYEKRLKFIAMRLLKMLRKINVKADYEIIRLIYDYYLWKGFDKTKDNMINAQPVYYVKVSKFNPDPNFSKIIISASTYLKLKNHHLKKKKKTRNAH